MSKEVFDLASQTAYISGRFPREYQLELQWLPYYIEDFDTAMRSTHLHWEKCKFIRGNSDSVPH